MVKYFSLGNRIQNPVLKWYDLNTGVEDLESSVESLATLVGAQVGAVTDKYVM